MTGGQPRGRGTAPLQGGASAGPGSVGTERRGGCWHCGGIPLAAVSRGNPVVLQVAFFGFRHFLRGRRAELGPAPLMALGRKSPHAGREGWRHPSGNRPAFSFLGHFSKILFTVLFLRGGELSALAVEGKPFVASSVPGGPCLRDLSAQKTLLHSWGWGVGGCLRFQSV